MGSSLNVFDPPQLEMVALENANDEQGESSTDQPSGNLSQDTEDGGDGTDEPIDFNITSDLDDVNLVPSWWI